MTLYPGGIAPEEFQVIKMAGLFVEEGNNDVAGVKEYPSSLVVALYCQPG